MPRTQHKKKTTTKQKTKAKISIQSEFDSWKDIISDKLLTDYALPLTKNVEARLHELNEKLEHNRTHH